MFRPFFVCVCVFALACVYVRISITVCFKQRYVMASYVLLWHDLLTGIYYLGYFKCKMR
jgi:hypothetical protein